MVGMDPPSRMKMGFTAGAVDEVVPATGPLSGCGSDLSQTGSVAGSSVAALVSVDDVGTGAADVVERLCAPDFPAEDVVVELITRSTCEARLSLESLRKRPGPDGFAGARPLESAGRAGYWCLEVCWFGVHAAVMACERVAKS